VWSPENEHLILQRGNFEGICIIQASRLQNEIKTHPYEDFIRVYEKSTGTALVHSSGKWKSNDEFGFSVGLSGDSWDFSYNIKTKTLTVSGSATNFEGENSLGKVSLETK